MTSVREALAGTEAAGYVPRDVWDASITEALAELGPLLADDCDVLGCSCCGQMERVREALEAVPTR